MELPIIEQAISFDDNVENPTFCFKYLSKASIRDCRDHKFFYEFLMRLQKLSEAGWNKIRTDNRHGIGLEQIPIKQIKKSMPKCVTPDVKKLDVFRVNGRNNVFVGKQIKTVFRVFFIEARFGDIYDHN